MPTYRHRYIADPRVHVVLFKGAHCLLFVALDAPVAKSGSACDSLIVLSQLFVFVNDTQCFVAPLCIYGYCRYSSRVAHNCL